ncbi:4956_t:CDS:2 [Ambispora leptoticha]|uniref:4956_t:CDS:1 n=1 Tax=Ambispora leptoticha TaxID=144679 RepID=A0A9N8ZXE4_9GLOM|nr:4956_t:CDS:2 [Ambispora leptoticha]
MQSEIRLPELNNHRSDSTVISLSRSQTQIIEEQESKYDHNKNGHNSNITYPLNSQNVNSIDSEYQEKQFKIEINEKLHGDESEWIELKSMFDLKEFASLKIWQQVMAEFFGTTILIFLIGAAVVVVGDSKFPHPSLLIGFAHIPLILLLILATGPISGAHLNPFITITTIFTRLISLPRGLLYMTFQLSGGTAGGILIRAIASDESITRTKLGACSFNRELFSSFQAFTGETVFCFGIALVLFGVALDPIRKKDFGLTMSAFLVSAVFGFFVWLSGGLHKGWPGASMNPAKCFAFSVATEDFSGTLYL